MYFFYVSFYTGVPTLAVLQNMTKNMKKAKTAGVHITSVLELKQFCAPLALPPSLSALTTTTTALVGGSAAEKLSMVHIPTDSVYEVEGACLTGPAQIKWMGQLISMPNKFVLHADGKHKLHHGQWILLTLGTHYLRWDDHHKKLSNSFAPLIYLFCKQHETAGACKMMVDALHIVW